ncbi:AraC family transcriptional regulator ligand-binding domain-containing protein [Actinoplanes sp. NPDC048988]|uniref:AraC family transcriptional regulator n=1 Tax=Actinoplanes sp. NPDC048988 TaxID=3363901 RepID=UPI0037111230
MGDKNLTEDDMSVMVRAAALRGLPELVREIGGDASAMFGRFDMAPAVLNTTDELVSARVTGELLETFAADLHCPDLGLRLAARQDLAVLGRLAPVIQHSLTLGDAIDSITRFLFMHSPSLAVTDESVAERAELRALRFDCLIGPLLPQVADLSLGLLHRVLQLLSGGEYGLVAVHLAHQPPAAPNRYREFYGVETHFGRPGSALRLTRTSGGLPVAGADPFVREALREYLGQHVPFPEPPIEDQVVRLLGKSIGGGQATLLDVARQLRTHPRTVERRLSEAGTTFGELRDEVRKDTAYHLITATTAPLGRVAPMVGLTDQSSLSRAVRRWYGMSPLALRRSRTGKLSAAFAT